VSRLQEAACAQKALEDIVAMLPLPTVLVDWQLAPFYHNDAARKAAARWSGADPHLKNGNFRMPEDLLGELKEMRHELVSHSANFQQRIIAHRSVPGLNALLTINGPRSHYSGQPSFMIRFQSNGSGREARLAAITRLSPART
jgi:hypothetical protein